MSTIVVTGTNTDVGKTMAVAALARLLADAGFTVTCVKPAQTGEPAGSGDMVTVTRLSGITDTHEFARYPEPLAPNQSASRAGMTQLDFDDTIARIAALDSGDDTVVLVEGAGGLLVRIADDWTIRDVARRLDAPLVVVTSTGLGSLNLAELTVTAARDAKVTVAGLVGGSVPTDPDLATHLNLTEFEVVTGCPLLGCLPEGAGQLERSEFAAMAAESFDTAALLAALGLAPATGPTPGE
ncbi:dethiobiotin synthase [Corynebacterium mendelii]|uniref:ATP-dependent dethiobiotin synthetase BioD n=1 Tax=Corynebacterium mendelii TaxID=2765362 RepID=A0A939E165_9CORY|nr:dethiobiotin synthase [Corynebacterium mendelii]MBN9643577.1 ATP-dependent dethiobiotin synthetase BioD [Corynebacterium mendelii]